MDCNLQNLPTNKQDLIEFIFNSSDVSSDSPAINLEELPETFDKLASNMLSLIQNIHLLESIAGTSESNSEITRQIAKNPDGLAAFDAIQKSRCNMWADSLRLLLPYIEPAENPELIQSISKASCLEDIVACYKPELVPVVVTAITPFRNLFALHLSDDHLAEIFLP